MASKQQSAEARYFNLETKLQYENCDPIALLVEEYMLNLKVEHVKHGLLQLEPLSFVKDKPEDLKMYIQLPGTHADAKEIFKEMKDEDPMGEYVDDFSQCIMVKLLKEPPTSDRANMGPIKLREGAMSLAGSVN